MNEDKNYLRVRAIIADAIDVDEAMLTTDAHFIDDIGLDSLASLEVLVRLEREFALKIPEDQLVQLVSMAKVMELLKSKSAF